VIWPQISPSPGLRDPIWHIVSLEPIRVRVKWHLNLSNGSLIRVHECDSRQTDRQRPRYRKFAAIRGIVGSTALQDASPLKIMQHNIVTRFSCKQLCFSENKRKPSPIFLMGPIKNGDGGFRDTRQLDAWRLRSMLTLCVIQNKAVRKYVFPVSTWYMRLST